MTHTLFKGDFMNENQYPPEMQRLIQLLQKYKGLKYIVILIALVAFGSMSAFYTVGPNEEAVVIRLGKHLTNTTSGLHFKIPFGIDQITKIKTKIVHQMEFGFRTSNSNNRRTVYSRGNFKNESLMLTGDLNVADVQWVVQFQISDPFKFIFKTSDPLSNIRDISESIMRRVVGDKPVNDVLTTGRVEIASNAKVLMQEVLNKYDMGVAVKTIKLQDVNPPQVVQKSFNNVNAAKQEQEQMINKAEEAYNRVIPEARGKALQLVSEAEGFAEAILNRAHGDADRFVSIAREYRKAPAITKKRIYLETMESIFINLENITIVDQKIKGLLPVFDAKSSMGVTK